ncbi:WGR domain-containing protein [Ornithinimicrobium murale]|uniref:ATP-dependent DNA ligase n=1 Tax=Ornithinimicrobium murale TaxID=1050153 RepID=UPI000E0CC7BF|nr:WGR domain-containing protein [Ornithinimicrobium murale]
MSNQTEITVREATYIDPRSGNDKFYRTFVVAGDGGDGPAVWFSQYGRNGTAGAFTKPEFVKGEATAQAAADKKFDSKVKKGYNPTRQGTLTYDGDLSFEGARLKDTQAVLDVLATQVGSDITHAGEPVAAAEVATVLADVTPDIGHALIDYGWRPTTTDDTDPALPTRPMLASTLSPVEVSHMMSDTDWCAQLKYDGDRVVIEVRDGVVTALNRQGQAKTRNVGLAHTTPFTALGQGRWVFDGEVVGRTLVLFDLVVATDGHQTFCDENTTFINRYEALTVIAELLDLDAEAVIVAPLADSVGNSDAKADLLAEAVAGNREGIMLRYRKGTYESGRRSTYLVKHKLIKDADVIVTKLHSTKDSATLSVHGADGTLVKVGNASTIGKGSVEVGDVWTVTYLYVTDPANPRLFQPRLACKRYDKAAAECNLDQFADAGTDKGLI